jgi:multidrug efflux pump subunit AcrA (membrane-fusion protein)
LRYSNLIFPFVVLLLLSGCARQGVEAKKQEGGVVSVNVAPVEVREVRRTVESVGTMFPYDESSISAEIDGRVDDIKVDLGDQVTAGQVMVHIADEEQRYLLAQQEAQLRQALEKLGLKNESDKLNDIREAPGPRQAQADLYDAESRFKRVKSLVDQQIMSQSELDQAQSRYSAMQAAYENALYTARNLVSTVEQFKAQVDLQRKKLRDTTVRAPFGGYVKERTVTPGQYVRVNTPLITLVKIDPIRLRLEVPERMAPWIKEGQIAECEVEAFEGRRFNGKIWRISPTVDQAKRTFVVEALIENPNGLLKPGSYARARIPTNKVETIKLVPNTAVNYVFGSNKAYVIANGTVQTREVKLGDRFGENIEIAEGVELSEQVAVTQLNRLDTGTRVRIVAKP